MIPPAREFFPPDGSGEPSYKPLGLVGRLS
jgi:hypothetical protein